MYQLLETINITNNEIKSIYYHNKRCNASRAKLFGSTNAIDLAHVIKLPDPPQAGRYKCRVLYNKTIISVELAPYTPKTINSLKIVHADDLTYDYKYADRGSLEKLTLLKADCDDILIVKDKNITDTSYSNIVFFGGKKWYTPHTPLLKGTKREMLLEKKIIEEAKITITDLRHFTKACLINAMLDLGEMCLPVENIV